MRLDEHYLASKPLSPFKRKKIAIIGSGISGLAAAWLLSREHNVWVFESGDYIGGHSHTVDVRVDEKVFPVDTGFIVFNPKNYPNLTELFRQLEVATVQTSMSFSASLNNGGFEYSSEGKAGFLAQPRNLFRPHFWSMLSSLLRFYGNTDRYLNNADLKNLSLRDLLKVEGYSAAFIESHLGPMGAAIWSSDAVNILDYPALSFLRFFKNHGLTQLKDRPQWRTVKGGSREYVKRLSASFRERIMLSTPVQSVMKNAVGIEVHAQNRPPELFDHVVFACHSDQALALMDHPSPLHGDVLGQLRYRPSDVYLHTDKSFMPKRRRAWASWNYIEDGGGQQHGPAVSYWMNQLQHLPVDTPVITTLNPSREIAPSKILGHYVYDHPVFDCAALSAKEKLWTLQGLNNFWFCGAYMGDGFHEDGLQSGLAVAEMLGGVRRPWQLPEQNARIGLGDVIDMSLESAA